MSGSFPRRLHFGLGVFGGFVGGGKGVSRLLELCFQIFRCLLSGGSRFGRFQKAPLLFFESFFRCPAGFCGLFDSLELRSLICLRRLQGGFVKINLRFGEHQGAFTVVGEFPRVTVAFQFGNLPAIARVPKFGDFVRAG